MDDSPDQLEALLDVAREAAAAGAEVALRWQARRTELEIEEKSGPSDLVSRADRDAESAVLEVLSARRPDDAVLAEEGGTSGDPDAAVRWAVDPVDGTTNFLYGRADWCVSVAALRASDGAPLAGVVHEPVTGRVSAARLGGGTTSAGERVRVAPTTSLAQAVVDVGLGRPPLRSRAGRLLEALVPAVRDVRRTGSAATALACVATGRVDACWSPGLEPWDAAAGVLLVREAGGAVGDLTGDLPGVPRHVLAGPAALLPPLRDLLRDVYADLLDAVDQEHR